MKHQLFDRVKINQEKLDEEIRTFCSHEGLCDDYYIISGIEYYPKSKTYSYRLMNKREELLGFIFYDEEFLPMEDKKIQNLLEEICLEKEKK